MFTNNRDAGIDRRYPSDTATQRPTTSQTHIPVPIPGNINVASRIVQFHGALVLNDYKTNYNLHIHKPSVLKWFDSSRTATLSTCPQSHYSLTSVMDFQPTPCQWAPTSANSPKWDTKSNLEGGGAGYSGRGERGTSHGGEGVDSWTRWGRAIQKSYGR